MSIWNPFKIHPIKAYWWRGVPNFGDAMAPLLLKRFAEIEKIEWNEVSNASIISIGSILEHLPPLWSGYILGSGKLFEKSKLDLSSKKVTILALRGPLSAKGIAGDFALGDPGLLADELVGLQEKKWDLGIIPHWRDTKLAERFIHLIPKKSTYKIIRYNDDPLDVIAQIGSSRRVVTSSLHGAIVADAFGIPRRIEICDKLKTEGGTFKFRDYSESINFPFKVGVMGTPRRVHVEDRKYEIWDAYQALRGDLKIWS